MNNTLSSYDADNAKEDAHEEEMIDFVHCDLWK